ncbi:MAG: mandelate racemase/muconate lactonizing enzyme family protein [Caldilineaceae bacterium]
MKITSLSPIVVEVNRRGDWVFVQIETDEGIVGIGEASHSSNDALCLAVLDQFATQLHGKDPLQIAAIRQFLRKSDGGRVYNTALSAVEQALWDILGQYLEVPVHVLFGGAMRDRIRLYANINRHVNERTPEGFARAAVQATEQGFTAIKLAPFDELRPGDHIRTGPKATWRPGVERVRAVRRAIGDNVELAVDCHSRMDRAEALVIAAELADCNLFWFEEPVHHTQPDDLRLITETVPMPTASAESVFGIEGFRPFLTQRTVDAIMPDVKHCGGILELAEIAAAARMNRVLVAPHNPAGPLSTAATAQVAATWSNFYILEYAWGEVDWRADLLDPVERIEDGYLVLSQEVGLGHRLNPDVVAAHRRGQAGAGDTSKVVV